MEKLTPLNRLLNLLSVDRRDVGYVYLYAAFSGLINLSLPLGIQAIINLITGGQISTSWGVLIGFVIAGIALAGGLQIFQLRIIENLQQRIFARASFEFSYRIPRIKLESLDNYYAPELVNRFFDTLSVQKGFSKILVDFSTSTLQIVFGLILLSFYHPFFVFFGIVLAFLIYLLFRLTGPAGMKTSLQESKEKYKVAHWLEEVARTMKTFKLAGNSELPMEKTDKFVSEYLSARKDHFRILIWQFINIVGFKTAVSAGLLILGSLLVLDQQINIGQFVAAEIIIILVINSVEKLILSMETVYDVLTALEKLGNVTDLPLESEEGIETEIDAQKGGMDLQVRNLTYQFPDAKEPILKNVNLNVENGEKICIAGFNGSGKTTLLHLVTGLYEPQRGTILYDGIPFGNLRIASVRSCIGKGLVQEEIFQGTIEENIRLGRPNTNREEMIQVAKDLDFFDYIQNLPRSFGSQIDPEGRIVPRSVARKILLARSLVIRPRLLVVEDVFGGLESGDRHHLIEYITSKEKPWTLLTISNDYAFAKECDRTIIMKEGTIIADDHISNLTNEIWFPKIFESEPQSHA